ncbi:hypothetical protein EYF80_056819 [Liparis tanakae]|uniref:Uncharacterized protein n=1 Tax=Liparis tanakae TaxID=230148 RepID=A0A4Z2EW28_9TELE|nr:hypothetical protein EYF80_056819 [Liparis tanakae]
MRLKDKTRNRKRVWRLARLNFLVEIGFGGPIITPSPLLLHRSGDHHTLDPGRLCKALLVPPRRFPLGVPGVHVEPLTGAANALQQ